jgi:hypothetical protein
MLALLMLTAAGVGTADKQPWDGPAFSGDPATIARAAASAPSQEDVDAVVLLAEQRRVFHSFAS